VRLLIAGSTAPWALEHHYIKHLSPLGLTLEVFDSANFVNYTILDRALVRLGNLSPYRRANEGLLQKVEAFKPDVVWIFKGVEYQPETLRKIKSRGVKLVNYNPDHPFIRTSASHGGKNVEACVPLYDLHFCYSRDLAAKIETEFGIPTAWLPFGFELDESVFEKISQTEEVLRVGFVGNPDQIRARIVRQLADAGLPVDVYGFGWHKFLRSHQNINVFDAVLGEAFWQKIRQYRVQLNIFRPHNIGSHNMRSFEIPAAGGVMLAPDSPEHRAFFSHGEEAFFYKTEEEMEGFCRDLLAREDVSAIRERARDRSISENYSYQSRANSASEVLKRI
jgi:spore maturation protein CgeB